MNTIFVLAVAFGGIYAVLRVIGRTALEFEMTNQVLLVAGILSWCLALLFFAWLGVTVFFLYDLFAARHLDNLYALMLIGIVSALFFLIRESIDADNVAELVKKGLFFEKYGHHNINIREELDKAKVKKVYKDLTGKTLADPKKEWTPMDPATRTKLLQELEAVKRRLTVSPHVDVEVKSLQSGEEVALTDSWRINSLRHAGHDLYESVFDVLLNPVTRQLRVRVHCTKVVRQELVDPKKAFRLKQDIYDFLQALQTEGWMQPYLPYIEQVELFGHLTEDDGFQEPVSYSFLRVLIPINELKKREKTFFNAADLHTIAVVEFKNGEPLDPSFLST